MKLILLKIIALFIVNITILFALIFIIPVYWLEPIIFKDSKFKDILDNYRELFINWHRANTSIIKTRSLK